MKVYVSEMPKSCEKCKFYEYEIEHNGEWGFETHRRMCKINGSLIQGICPLQSLADYTKQVRKEVCEDIAKKMENKLVRMQPDGEFGTRLAIDWYDINKVLDQIQD